MDSSAALSIATLVLGAITAGALAMTSITNFRATIAAKKAAERAETNSIEAVVRARRNADTLSKITHQLDGQLALFRELVQKEADQRIAAAELHAEQQFMAGVEKERSAPIATAASVAEVRQIVTDAAEAAKPANGNEVKKP